MIISLFVQWFDPDGKNQSGRESESVEQLQIPKYLGK
jgi:hypothetical protein